MRVFHRRLEPTEEGAKQELHFSFDAEIDGEAQIFWECVDMTLPDVLEQPANLKKLGLDLLVQNVRLVRPFQTDVPVVDLGVRDGARAADLRTCELLSHP